MDFHRYNPQRRAKLTTLLGHTRAWGTTTEKREAAGRAGQALPRVGQGAGVLRRTLRGFSGTGGNSTYLGQGLSPALSLLMVKLLHVHVRWGLTC